MKAYVVSGTEDGIKDIAGVYHLITEKGELLASHMCSRKEFALNSIYANRFEKIESYSKRYGKLEIDYLGKDDMTMDRLVELNKIQRGYE